MHYITKQGDHSPGKVQELQSIQEIVRENRGSWETIIGFCMPMRANTE